MNTLPVVGELHIGYSLPVHLPPILVHHNFILLYHLVQQPRCSLGPPSTIPQKGL